MTAITRKANRKFPSLPVVAGDLPNHTEVLMAAKAALEIGQRRTPDFLSSFVAVRDLVDLGIIDEDGNFILEVSDDDDDGGSPGVDTDDQTAAEVPYNNGSSGLSATNVQTAIDELAAFSDTDDQTAAEVPYSNSSSGLSATNVQDAIDEVLDNIVLSADTVVSQAADLTITSDNVFQTTGLSVSLTAGVYIVEARIWASAHATPDMEIQFQYTGTVVNLNGRRTAFRITTPTTSEDQTVSLADTLYNMNDTSRFYVEYAFLIEVSDSGTFALYTRQVTSSGTAVTFLKGSVLRVRKTAT